MPNYDYHCEQCEYTWEDFLPIARRNDPCEKPCPICCGGPVKKLIGSPAIVDPVLIGVKRPITGFQKRLREIAQSHKSKNIPTNDGSRTSSVLEY